MFKFFRTIINLIGVVVSFIHNAVESIVALFETIGKAMRWAFDLINYLPPSIVIIVITIVSYAIVVNVMNKGS